MDGLSAVSSAFAVVSLAIQCADGLIKMHDFFERIKHASEEIANISNDLRLLSGIVEKLHLEEQVYHNVLEHLRTKVSQMQGIVVEIESGFKSGRTRDRHWSAFKAVKSSAAIRRFRQSLEETKTTLMIGLQAKTLAEYGSSYPSDT